MEVLVVNVKDLVYYIIIIICLLVIAVILLKYWSIRKEEKEDKIVVRKIESPKPKPEVKKEVRREVKTEIKKEPKIEMIQEEPEELVNELEQVLQEMQSNLSQEKDVTQIFEEEQEEKAIISYQELIRANLKQDIQEEEPASLPKLSDFPDIEEEIPMIDDAVTPVKKADDKKFKQTDFISPIYGTMDVRDIPKKTAMPEVSNIDVEKTLNIAGITEEKKKNAEFLQSLKEFRNNL